MIALSACIALPIREAANKAREDSLSNMEIIATISKNRMALMGNSGEQNGTIDRDTVKEQLQNISSLTLDRLETYATAESVKSFYYTLSASMNASGDLEPVDTMGTFSKNESSSSSGESQANGKMPGGNHKMQALWVAEWGSRAILWSLGTAVTAP